MNNGNETRRKILEVLSQHSEGLTILDVAELVGAHRHTVTKYIYELVGAGIIKLREIGSAKLCMLNGNHTATVEKEVAI